ncbi:MAG: AAA family ATPase [Bacteroidota bacterium]
MTSCIKKYIITGAPGTGKTTLIHALEKHYLCMHEVSRKVIAQEQQSKREGTPWQDLSRFATLFYEYFIRTLKNNPQALITDRSLLDLAAYHLVEGMSIPAYIDEFPYHETFQRKVFFNPTWQEIYRVDEQRQQTFEYCIELEKALKKTYVAKKFQLDLLPKDTVAHRVEFVKKSIKIAG